nr:conotoxin precursor U [Conus ebraeus]DAZ86283.1 TPA_inf: conotoxin precursor U [Conus ebraeus]
MGFFLTLTVAVLLTSLICTDGAPAKKLEVKSDCSGDCMTCSSDLPCGCCGNVICHSTGICQLVSDPYEDY